jgi:hypothetical protein
MGAFDYITSISAWSAPAALMACRIAIMSRGVTPRALEALDEIVERGAAADDGDIAGAALADGHVGARHRPRYRPRR